MRKNLVWLIFRKKTKKEGITAIGVALGVTPFFITGAHIIPPIAF